MDIARHLIQNLAHTIPQCSCLIYSIIRSGSNTEEGLTAECGKVRLAFSLTHQQGMVSRPCGGGENQRQQEEQEGEYERSCNSRYRTPTFIQGSSIWARAGQCLETLDRVLKRFNHYPFSFYCLRAAHTNHAATSRLKRVGFILFFIVPHPPGAPRHGDSLNRPRELFLRREAGSCLCLPS